MAGTEIAERRLIPTSLQLTAEQWEWLQALARRNDRSASAELRRIVTEAKEREARETALVS